MQKIDIIFVKWEGDKVSIWAAKKNGYLSRQEWLDFIEEVGRKKILDKREAEREGQRTLQ